MHAVKSPAKPDKTYKSYKIQIPKIIMDDDLELSLGSDGISVMCPQKKNVTVYRCMKLSRIGACSIDDRKLRDRDIKYKLPFDVIDDLYHAFEKSERRCKYCTGVSVGRNLLISSVFCNSNRNRENK